MPFGYFGAKHGLARFYPLPRYDVVIEPFAGAAGYSCYWARQGLVKHAILTDTNPHVVTLWHRLQRMTERQLMKIECPPKGEKTLEPLIAAASGRQGMDVMRGRPQSITDRMLEAWPRLQENVARMLPYIKTWEVRLGSFKTNRNVKATWFVDPPYKDRMGSFGKETAGRAYKQHGTGFEYCYDDLSDWVRSRRGQVIACEQMPADWLPFVALRNQRNGVGAGTQSTRTEAIWTND